MAVIGITCLHDNEKQSAWLPDHYFRAVEKVGGTSVLLPPLGPGVVVIRLVQMLDGLLLAGGEDLDPLYFGEEPLPATGLIAPDRDRFEIALVREALRAGRPVLGICRGLQVLNVAAGGDIHQDISLAGARFKHFQNAPRWYPTHQLQV
ncbi:MAG: gamma-glutamyl-gamma-aminobutyrate hydrolase family protein, partial [Candidatus Desulforudis sp.]|nr:gamma-glutamyl-gamma-aminobutyrate hydrolase family protein [Desulforudis sp.]